MSTEEFNEAAAADAMAQAAAAHDFDAIKALVNAGASPDAPLPGFGTVLIYAVTQGQQALAEHLVRAGARIDLADAAGNTPLHHAAGLGLQSIAECLVEAGADALVRNKAGESAFDASRAAARALEQKFNESDMSVEDLENAFSRLGRIAALLKDAEKETRRRHAIDSCHGGIRADMTVGQPIKFKTP